MNLNKLIQKKYRENPGIVKGALALFSTTFQEAKPTIEEIKDLLKDD